jgi:hypothetical protein
MPQCGLALFGLALLAGCARSHPVATDASHVTPDSGGNVAQQTNRGSPAVPGGAAPETGCADDRGCALVDATCCDCNHGGKRIALQTARAGAYTQRDCSAVMCTQMMSNDPSCLADARARCEGGRCVVSR